MLLFISASVSRLVAWDGILDGVKIGLEEYPIQKLA